MGRSEAAARCLCCQRRARKRKVARELYLLLLLLLLLIIPRSAVTHLRRLTDPRLTDPRLPSTSVVHATLPTLCTQCFPTLYSCTHLLC